jgi:hypothetical protein
MCKIISLIYQFSQQFVVHTVFIAKSSVPNYTKSSGIISTSRAWHFISMKQLKIYTGVQLQAYLDVTMYGGADLQTPHMAVKLSDIFIQ